jgi:hypothetical protein
MRSSRLAAALLGTAVLAAGCASTVTGTATSAASPPVTTPPASVPAPAAVDLHAGDLLRLADVAATPDGDFLALLVADPGSDARTTVVRLTPGDGGLTAGAVAEAPLFDHPGELLLAPDGSVVTLGTVPPEAGDPSGDLSDGPDLVLAVLPPGGTQAEVRAVGADPELGPPESGSGVLSADGATVYAALRWTVDGETVTRLATVDVATGGITATAPLGVETPGLARAYDVTLLPDGGVAVLVTAHRDAERTVDHTLVVRLDADLRPVGAPVELVPDEPNAGYALIALPDGTLVATVSVGIDDDGGEDDDTRLVTVRDGAVQATTDLPGTALGLAVSPAGDRAFVTYHGDAERGEDVAATATVDLASGEVVDDVFLCPDGTAYENAVSADGRAVVVTAACYEDGVPHVRAFLLAG